MESQVSTKKEAEEDLTTEEERQKKTSHARKEAVIRVMKSLLKSAQLVHDEQTLNSGLLALSLHHTASLNFQSPLFYCYDTYGDCIC